MRCPEKKSDANDDNSDDREKGGRPAKQLLRQPFPESNDLFYLPRLMAPTLGH